MIAAWIGAAVVGVSLGLFGSGGSILTVPLLTLLLHRTPHQATVESLVIVALISAVGALMQARRRLVDLRIAFLFAAVGALGAPIGARLHAAVPERATELAFSALVASAAVALWRRAVAPKVPGDPTAWQPAKAVSAAVGVGVLTGFLGVGGGFLLVPAMLLFGGLPIARAAATSLVVIAINSSVAFAAHHARGGVTIDLALVGLVAAVGSVGSAFGVVVAPRMAASALQRSFALVLVVVAIAVAIGARSRA